MKHVVLAAFGLLLSNLAYAESAAGGATSPSMVSNIVMLVGFLIIFYFMLIRPQAKRAKEHQALVTGIAKDDEIVTTGGILGKVTKVTDQFLVIAIAEGIEVKVQRQAVAASLPKGTIKNI